MMNFLFSKVDRSKIPPSVPKTKKKAISFIGTRVLKYQPVFTFSAHNCETYFSTWDPIRFTNLYPDANSLLQYTELCERLNTRLLQNNKYSLGRTNNPDSEEIQLLDKAVSSNIGKESTSSIPVSYKDVSSIEEIDDLFNDVSSITSSSDEDDMNATTKVSVKTLCRYCKM